MEGNRPQINDGCPKDLLQLISHCWESDSTKRPVFKNVVKDLMAIIENASNSMPNDIEHVKLRKSEEVDNTENKKKKKKKHNKKHKKSKKNKKSKTHKSNSKVKKSSDNDDDDGIPLDDLTK